MATELGNCWEMQRAYTTLGRSYFILAEEDDDETNVTKKTRLFEKAGIHFNIAIALKH